MRHQISIATFIFIIAFMCFLSYGITAQGQQIRSQDEQISAALSAAPEELRAEATVMGYKADTTLATLREGTNKLLCIADDPRRSNFHVACYHEDLEPFMKRGRALKAKGMSQKEIDLIRRSEIKSGKLTMPEKPMALYIMDGKEEAFNYSKSRINEGSPRYVIYVPYATEASTGLSRKPASKGAPWLMEPGTPWAHIMVITGRSIKQ